MLKPLKSTAFGPIGDEIYLSQIDNSIHVSDKIAVTRGIPEDAQAEDKHDSKTCFLKRSYMRDQKR